MYGRRGDVQEALVKVREDPAILCKEDPKICPRRFDVRLIDSLRRKMEGPKTFVQALEKHVPEFYTQVGQYLRPWVPSAPRVAGEPGEEEDADDEGAEASESGEVSTDGSAAVECQHP